MLADKYYCICEEKVLFPCKIKVLAVGVGTRAEFRYRDLPVEKFQYHIIAVSFLRSAMRIYNSVHYGRCVSLYSFNPFSLPKRKKTCSKPELLFFSCRVPKTIVASWFAIRKRFCASGKFLRITLEIALGSF